MPLRVATPRFSRFARALFAIVAVIALRAETPTSIVPLVPTAFALPSGVSELPEQPGLPDLLRSQTGAFITSPDEWPALREAWRVVLENYATGHAPAAPDRVVGHELKTGPVLAGAATYRLVHLAFGPEERLGFDIAIFIPNERSGSPCPVVVLPSFALTPGAAALPLLPRPLGQGKGVDALLPVDPLPAAIPAPLPADRVAPSPEAVAEQYRELLGRGYALVTYHYQDTGEDTTLRLPDGGWAFRTTRFFPAYPGHDWGLLAAWAWGMSRVVDYLVTQPFADPARLIATGHSRLGKAALVAGAYDRRFALVAPAGTGGGGSGAYRFSGAGRGGKEGLDEMMRKYPNWFGPHLRAFSGHVERLPYDQHAFIALVAPRAFIALEATADPVSLPSAVVAAAEGARPVYSLLGATKQLGFHFANHGHAYAAEDWTTLLDFADWRLLGRDSGRSFNSLPPSASPSP